MAYDPILGTLPFGSITSFPSTLSGLSITSADVGTLLNGVMPISAIKTSNYTATASDYFIPVDSTSGNITITLPTTVGTGKVYVIKKIIAANSVIIDPNSSATIDGAANFSMTNRWEVICAIFNGTNYYIF